MCSIHRCRTTSGRPRFPSRIRSSSPGIELGGDGASAEVAAPTIVRIAVYDTMTAPPRVEEVFGDSSAELIERLSARVYQMARDAGGSIPYTVIRELTENLLHAGFADVVVSVLDDGSTVRIADAGPGIADVDRAIRPGFSTATREMRGLIRGVGSGLPIAAECMRFNGGGLLIDENLGGGTVVTAFVDEATARSVASPAATGPTPAARTMTAPPAGGQRYCADISPVVGTVGGPSSPVERPAAAEAVPIAGPPDGVVPVSRPAPAARQLSTRQKQTLLLVMEIGSVGPTTISRELTVALSTAHRDLEFLEAEGLISG